MSGPQKKYHDKKNCIMSWLVAEASNAYLQAHFHLHFIKECVMQ